MQCLPWARADSNMETLICLTDGFLNPSLATITWTFSCSSSKLSMYYLVHITLLLVFLNWIHHSAMSLIPNGSNLENGWLTSPPQSYTIPLRIIRLTRLYIFHLKNILWIIKKKTFKISWSVYLKIEYRMDLQYLNFNFIILNIWIIRYKNMI